MRRLLLFLLLTNLFLFSSCLKELGQLGYYETTICRGVVYETGTNQPLANVLVTTTDGMIVDAQVFTSDDGTFEIPVNISKLDHEYFVVVHSDSLLQTYTFQVNELELGSQYFDIDTIFFSGPVLPELEMSDVMDVTTNSVLCYASIIDNGNAHILERGFVFDTFQYPTLSNHSVISTEDGSYYSATLPIFPDKVYYVRAFARNSAGVGYSDQISFTSGSVLPVVTTSTVSDITASAAKCGGEVVSAGSSDLVARGLCWSTSPNPTRNNVHVEVGNGVGIFRATLSGLLPNTTYYVRAYAQNQNGTSYGDQYEFTTLSGLPVVTTSEPINVTSTSALAGGEVVSDAGFPVIRRGICYGTTANPTISDAHTLDGSGLGQFQSHLAGLPQNTRIYIRAYATNGNGTVYGSQQSFVTQ